MGYGGARPGSGRKKGNKAIQAEKMREHLIQKVGEEFVPILTAQIEAAKGMFVEEKIGKESVKVYQLKPDLKAGEYLLNQGVGKPRESIEMVGDIQLKVDI